VTDPEDLKQAVNELYTRINAMGVGERSIRIENSNILLDFPGVQGLSADDLVQASAMSFHIVNEKFSAQNPTLREATQTFLQEVWNEAVVTNRKDAESVNLIAWEHLGGSVTEGEAFRPRSESARILLDNGLRLASPSDATVSAAFNDTVSAIAMWRGDDHTQWHGQTHPLLIVFRNYALEGSSLDSVQSAYDPTHGNILTFTVRSSYTGRHQTGNPRDDFFSWTSQFAKSRIAGTVREAYSRGEGWRMAVILNGSVISAPTLNEPLRDQAMIHGNFSQREVNRLVADLKAGSLSFTPKILSETNVSPDLGKEERFWGITAAIVGLVSVVVAMVSYYRFGGVVASAAVLLNLLIMWGV
ncbi:MAG: protein translocase subunit SecDF, partial [Chlamydiia bacterium]|nr:protein translocase subunit SecDF [Chlamydiia bacterium]